MHVELADQPLMPHRVITVEAVVVQVVGYQAAQIPVADAVEDTAVTFAMVAKPVVRGFCIYLLLLMMIVVTAVGLVLVVAGLLAVGEVAALVAEAQSLIVVGAGNASVTHAAVRDLLMVVYWSILATTSNVFQAKLFTTDYKPQELIGTCPQSMRLKMYFEHKIFKTTESD